MAQPAEPVAAWRYVIPNAVTSASLVVGLLVMVAAMDGRFEAAGWLMVMCVLLDKLDGTTARLLGATSKFGVQLDSLADLVVFGVAPAATLHLLARSDADLYVGWGPWTWVLHASLAVFVICSALRLAKFNVATEREGPSVFFGMPTTLAGGLLGLLLLIGLKYELFGLLRALPIIALLFAVMMVSNLPLPKVGRRKSKAMYAFQAINLALCYGFGFARVFPEYLLTATLSYALVGFAWGLRHRGDLGDDEDDGEDEGDADGGPLDLEPQPG